MLTCAELHVHKVIKNDREAPRHKWVDHALPLQVLRTEEDARNTQWTGLDSFLRRVLIS